MDLKLEKKLMNRFHYFHAPEYKNRFKRCILRTFNHVKASLLLAWMTKKPVYPFEYFGFECGDGWFKLIWDLCIEIEPYVSKHFQVTQVKEKFGMLCFYNNSSSEEADKIINKYENLSETICESCGTPGKMRDLHGWMQTACDKCFKEWKDDLEKRMNPGGV